MSAALRSPSVLTAILCGRLFLPAGEKGKKEKRERAVAPHNKIRIDPLKREDGSLVGMGKSFI